MTAQSAGEYDPDDPVEILRILPGRFHDQFLAEYDAAVTGARRPEHYHKLHHVLRLWRLRAAAYSDPGFATRLEAVQDAAAAGRREGTPIEEIVPDWSERVAASRRRAALRSMITGPCSSYACTESQDHGSGAPGAAGSP